MKRVNKIVIAGGGTSGWMTAAKLSQHFSKTDVQITLVESSQIGTIGVGEATIPTLRRFYQSLGMDDLEVIRKTQATVKLGIEFQDWREKGSAFFHPFGVFGQNANGVRFHNYWLKLNQLGHKSKLSEYCLAAELAKENRFTFPSENPRSSLSVYDWALHFDAALFAELMATYAREHGVNRIDAKIENINLNEFGEIKSLTLSDGVILPGDLFIDCTGFRSLLLQESLGTGYQNWSDWLFCDKAVSVQATRHGAPLVKTVSKAHSVGWQWKIPLQQRQGNGYVYSSKHISDDDASNLLVKNVDGELIHEPRFFSFTPGRANKAWNKNCVAVGLSSGFLEPLESTSIALIETAIEKICGSFPKPGYDENTVNRFNEVTATEYERIRDFIIMHYKLTKRDDSEFWQACQSMDVPDTLAEKISTYNETGELLHWPWEIFHPDSWLAIYDGFEVYPGVYNKKVDRLDDAYLVTSLSDMKFSVKKAVEAVTTHEEFLASYCGYCLSE